MQQLGLKVPKHRRLAAAEEIIVFIAGRRRQLLGKAKSVRNWRISGIRENNDSIPVHGDCAVKMKAQQN
jgi:hypothetical protein